MDLVSALTDFQKLGCSDQIKCALACRVFLDLKEDKRVTNLEKHFDEAANTVYLRGERGGSWVTFLPLLDTQPLDLELVKEFQRKYGGEGDGSSGSVTLAICDTSSNVLYYQLTQGFVDKTS